MYLIKHIKRCNYFKNKITKDLWHYVYSEKEAHQFINKKQAQKMLETFHHPEHFEIVCTK